MPAQQRLWLNDEERLLPCPNHPCQEDEEHAIRFRACGAFHLAPEDDELLSQEGIFCHQLGLASAKVGQGLQRQGGSERSGPLKKASSQSCNERTHEPFETRRITMGCSFKKMGWGSGSRASIGSRLHIVPELYVFCNQRRYALSLLQWFSRTDDPSSQYSAVGPKEKIIVVELAPGQSFMLVGGTCCDGHHMQVITQANGMARSLQLLNERSRSISAVNT